MILWLALPPALCALICGLAAVRITATRRLQAGWAVIALALAFLSAASVLRLHAPSPDVVQGSWAAWSILFALAPATLTLGIFALWVAGLDRNSRSVSIAEGAMDAFIAGGSAAALLWWLLIEPAARAANAGQILAASNALLPLVTSAFHFVTFALLALYIVPARRWNLASVSLLAGVGLLICARYSFFLVDIGRDAIYGILTALAAACIATAAWNDWRGELQLLRAPLVASPLDQHDEAQRITALQSSPDANDGKPARVSKKVAAAIETLSRIPHETLVFSSFTRDEELHWMTLRRNVTIILPALALVVFAWHSAGKSHGFDLSSGGLVGQISGVEAWWPSCLVILTFLRHATRTTPLEQEDRDWAEELQKSAIVMGEELNRRTYQLSLLHAVTADLNDSLDCTGVLFTALARMSDAVNADAGALWLRLDLDELSEKRNRREDDNPLDIGVPTTLSNTTFILRELERWEADQRSLAKLQSQTKVRLDATTNLGEMPAGRRWRLAKVQGDADKTARAALTKVHGALEGGGLLRGMGACKTLNANWGSAHLAAIRWKGTVLGTVALFRKQKTFEANERAMLDTLGMEVGRALQNAQLFQEAIRLADRDSLTDLLNHRAMQQHLNAILAQSRRTGQEFAVVMMDVNNFKFFNDTYGHPVGDRVIRTVARCLHEACRKEDIVGRFGGDEFIAILTDTGEVGTLETCSRIAARLEEEAYQEARSGRRVPIGVSFGAAVYPQDGDNPLDLIAVADANLYEAKTGGEKVLVQRRHAEEATSRRELRDAHVGGSFGVLDALVTAIDNKDHYTRRHSEDVSHWAILMARELGYDEDAQRVVRVCALLHDVGKIAVPDVILRKPGRLNEDDYHIVQQHPVFGALIVKDIPHLAEVLGGIRHHHERIDGTGYPDGLAGATIPILGRLLAVPDCFSAMTTERPYRKALSWSEAIEEIERGKDRQFDPDMVEVFLRVMARVMSSDDNKSSEERALKMTIAPPLAARGQVAAH